MYADQLLTCVDCGQEFAFTAGEQEFYAQKGFQNTPARCPQCRQARKGGRSGAGAAGGGYEAGRQSGGRAREMFRVTCSNCGRMAEVPFQPRGDKPVYCKECFQRR